MRSIILIILISTMSCNQQAQEKNGKPENKFDMVRIDSVSDIPKGTVETSQTFIKQRLEALVGNFLKEKCTQNGLTYPPKFVLFRFFKHEKEFEVWAGNSQTDSLRRILFLPVCAVDDAPGTKLQEGDGKTPEGFYNSPIYYGSSAGFMWIKLNNSKIDNYGKVGYGSSFKMCLDYPNAIDKLRTKTLLKTKSPGSAICIHANCVSIGCISFVNKNFLPIFLAALGHNTPAFGSIKIHIFPFRFNQISDEKRASFAKNASNIPEKQVLEFWNNLEKGYVLFNKNHKALNINIVNNSTYSFVSY